MAQAAGPQRIGRVMSVLGVPMLLAPILGPVIGGLIVTSVSWRWIFYVNVPIGIVADHPRAADAPVDAKSSSSRASTLSGLLLLSPGLASVVYGLSQLGSSGSTTSVAIPLVDRVRADRRFRRSMRPRQIPRASGRLGPAPLIDVKSLQGPGFPCRPASPRSDSVRPCSEPSSSCRSTTRSTGERARSSQDS